MESPAKVSASRDEPDIRVPTAGDVVSAANKEDAADAGGLCGGN